MAAVRLLAQKVPARPEWMRHHTLLLSSREHSVRSDGRTTRSLAVEQARDIHCSVLSSFFSCAVQQHESLLDAYSVTMTIS